MWREVKGGKGGEKEGKREVENAVEVGEREREGEEKMRTGGK